MTSIRLRVRELREARGWSQRELAERAGVRRATIGAIEAAETSGVEFDVLERLANALDVAAGYLFVHEGRGEGLAAGGRRRSVGASKRS